MREAIERVIAELETEHKRNFEAEKRCDLIEDKYYRQGGQDGLIFSIRKLKEVLNTADNNPRNSTKPERDGQQEQSQ